MGSSQYCFFQSMQVLFLHKKPSEKVRLLNILSADDYTNDNHSASIFSDATQCLAGKFLFCKLGCSQAHHCLQVADQRSVEMLAFNSASETFGDKRLAQNPSISVSAFSSFMREYQAPVVKTDQHAQNVKHWDCSQQCYGSYTEHSSSFPVHSQIRIESDHRKVSFWSQTS